MNVLSYIKLLRPQQWIKNFFIFFPAFFAEDITQLEIIRNLLLSFFGFSFIASSVYVINDYADIEKDKLHPEKMNRPLASGAVTKNASVILLFGMMTMGYLISFYLGYGFVLIVTTYFLLNLFYSFKLKHTALLDIAIISSGFLLRIIAGADVADVHLSKWLIMITFLLAMLLGLAKRRDDVLIQMESGEAMRKSIKGYNLEFINAAMVLMAGVTIVAYIMYTISEDVIQRIGNDYVFITAFFVVFGILRYLQITLVEEKSGSPTRILLKDLFIQVVILLWLISFIILLYVL